MEHILVTIALLGLYYFYRYYYRDDGNDYSRRLSETDVGYLFQNGQNVTCGD